MKKLLATLFSFVLVFVAFSFALASRADENGSGQSYQSGENDDEDENENEDEDKDENEDGDEDDWRERSREMNKNRIEEMKKSKNDWLIQKAVIRANAEKEKEKYRELRQKFTEEKCKKIEAQIQKRTSNYGTSKEKHMSAYNNLVNRINKFAGRFKTAGLDGTPEYAALTADLATLNGYIAEFKAAYAAYAAKLTATKMYACGQSEGAFRSQLVNARAELKIVHETAAKIRKFVRTDILSDIKALKALMPKDEDKDDESKDEDEDERLSVVITSPTNNSSYTAAGNVNFSAKAEDDDNVSKVEFYNGDVLKGTDATEPYAFNWAITAADNGTHSWTAKAYDKAAVPNAAVSAAVSVEVNIASAPTP